jgi:hypothetical protein
MGGVEEGKEMFCTRVLRLGSKIMQVTFFAQWLVANLQTQAELLSN